MANMSYCRFENTNRDFEDCVEAVEEAVFDKSIGIRAFTASLSNSEQRAFVRLVKNARKLIEIVGDDDE